MRQNYVLLFILALASYVVYCHNTEEIKFEFGGALKQVLSLSQPEDTDVVSVVKFAVQYAEKRYPWSVPTKITGKARKHPFVANLSKVNLIYSDDDIIPLHYDDVISDRHGNRHGITSMIVFGSIYRFQLIWRDKSFRFYHNFTLSMYPYETKNIYSHTFFIVSENVTESYNLNKEYLKKHSKNRILLHLPLTDLSEDSNYVDLTALEQLDAHNFESSHMTESIDQSEQKNCDMNSNECAEKSYKDTELKYLQFENRKFSVMSYNIWNMNPKSKKEGDYVKRMKQLKQVIASADPDILGLQEVRYEEMQGGELGPSQIHTIAEWFPEYQYVFQPGQMQSNSLYEGRTEEGVAVMSKFPIVAYNHKFLFRNSSNSADIHQRVLLHAEIVIPFLGKVHILNTHLSLSHEAREASVVQIWQYIKQLQGPVIFMGDLNAEPQERAIQYLNGKAVLNSEPPELLDVWLEKHGLKSNGYTFNPRDELFKRIDYMYIRPSDACCHIVSCDIIDNGKRGIKVASDHLPIQAVFSFQRKSKTR